MCELEKGEKSVLKFSKVLKLFWKKVVEAVKNINV